MALAPDLTVQLHEDQLGRLRRLTGQRRGVVAPGDAPIPSDNFSVEWELPASIEPVSTLAAASDDTDP